MLGIVLSIGGGNAATRFHHTSRRCFCRVSISCRGTATIGLPTIGFLSNASPDAFPDRLDAFRSGLRDIGYVEDRNVAIKYRWAEGHNDRLPALAAELVDSKVTGSERLAAQYCISGKSGDDYHTDSLSNRRRSCRGWACSGFLPGQGHVTGVTSLNVDVGSKRLELMHMLVPQATDMALLVNPTILRMLRTMQKRPSWQNKIGVQLHVMQGSFKDDFNEAFARSLQLG